MEAAAVFPDRHQQPGLQELLQEVLGNRQRGVGEDGRQRQAEILSRHQGQ
ncbi:hypothetical protein AB0L42_39410 [Streptomyces sp. NPDC052287]